MKRRPPPPKDAATREREQRLIDEINRARLAEPKPKPPPRAASVPPAGGMFLTIDEMEQLTDRERSDGQRRELDHLGIPYKVRRDNSLVVLRAVVELHLGGKVAPVVQEPQLMP